MTDTVLYIGLWAMTILYFALNVANLVQNAANAHALHLLRAAGVADSNFPSYRWLLVSDVVQLFLSLAIMAALFWGV